tara:strand:+ start:137 stop:691 length:555 start_codon:yes stop_codon:yes gene_type:complete
MSKEYDNTFSGGGSTRKRKRRRRKMKGHYLLKKKRGGDKNYADLAVAQIISQSLSRSKDPEFVKNAKELLQTIYRKEDPAETGMNQASIAGLMCKTKDGEKYICSKGPPVSNQAGGHHLYKRLGVTKYATKKTMKNAYNKLKKKNKLTNKVKYAYKILSKKKTRKQYNNKYTKHKKLKRKKNKR